MNKEFVKWLKHKRFRMCDSNKWVIYKRGTYKWKHILQIKYEQRIYDMARRAKIS